MSVVFTHKILECTTVDSLTGYKDVISQVKWQLIASFNENTAISEFIHKIPFDITKPFIPLEQLREEQIMSWIFDQFHPSDINAMKLGLTANVLSIK